MREIHIEQVNVKWIESGQSFKGEIVTKKPENKRNA